MITIKPLLFIVLGVWIASVISNPELRKNPLIFAIGDEVEVTLVNTDASNTKAIEVADSDYYDLIISDTDSFPNRTQQAGLPGNPSQNLPVLRVQTVEQFVTIIQDNNTARHILYFVSNPYFATLAEELKERYKLLNEDGVEI
jgi:hypothetical protein